MLITSKEIASPKDLRALLTELAEEAARGWEDVESGELFSVDELKARFGRGD